jgi:hypothetical protein
MARHTQLPHHEDMERRAGAFATSYATGTPPRGRASTTTSSRPEYPCSRPASDRPASARSRKRLGFIVSLVSARRPGKRRSGNPRRARLQRRGGIAALRGKARGPVSGASLHQGDVWPRGVSLAPTLALDRDRVDGPDDSHSVAKAAAQRELRGTLALEHLPAFLGELEAERRLTRTGEAARAA